ncbi:unnamed protein product [Euphydryas editha]|uniref:Uncharacterized protein n=1 Tax=Euphydryas editha TaxID=104508 RepID=A0AAU9UQ24_EUPED|nr:unnamed protein product [Euphydryas editha]
MEGAILSTQSNNRFRTHLKNAATILCARTLPRSRCSEQSSSSSRHHTYPRTSPPKRPSISCRMEPLMSELPQTSTLKQAESIQCKMIPQNVSKSNSVIKLKSTLAR